MFGGYPAHWSLNSAITLVSRDPTAVRSPPVSTPALARDGRKMVTGFFLSSLQSTS